MKNKIFKIIWIISFIIPTITFLIVNIIKKGTYEVYYSTNYLVLIIFGIINIIFGILLFKKEVKNLILMLYIIFIIITLFTPVYHNVNTYAPTGPRSELMGLAFNERYLNAYGININKLTSYMPIFMKNF